MKIVQTLALTLSLGAVAAFAANKAPSAAAAKTAPVAATSTVTPISNKTAPVKVASASKEEKEAAKAACKADGVKGKKAIKACVKEKLAAPKAGA